MENRLVISQERGIGIVAEQLGHLRGGKPAGKQVLRPVHLFHADKIHNADLHIFQEDMAQVRLGNKQVLRDDVQVQRLVQVLVDVVYRLLHEGGEVGMGNGILPRIGNAYEKFVQERDEQIIECVRFKFIRKLVEFQEQGLDLIGNNDD